MIDYRIVAIPEATAGAVRATLTSPRYGHPAHVEEATGYGPCRLCLQFFAVGEERRILFTYDPFGDTGQPPLPGPVYIHERGCQRYPEGGGVPVHLLEHPLTLAAYGPDRRVVEEVRLSGGRIEPALQRVLASSEVEQVHVRDTEAGCFDLRIERLERQGERSGVDLHR
jgi:hypothetical protein